MQGYLFSEIVEILKKGSFQGEDLRIDYLLTDSRKLLFPESTLFFAISTSHKNANIFIQELYKKGVRCFVVDQPLSDHDKKNLPEANIIIVENVLAALQQIAIFHRHRFNCPIIGVTGSNGKTIVKEWLYQLLNEIYNVAHSPKSYNSQVGVPLSVWSLNESHTLGIFEAGISQAGEMVRLQQIIDPEIGVLTYIGEAHAKGFASKEEKILEKLELFSKSKVLIYGADDKDLDIAVKRFVEMRNPSLKIFSWGMKGVDLKVDKINKEAARTQISLNYKGESFSFFIPFTDDASISNAITCCSVLLYLKISIIEFTTQMELLRAVEMRMELKHGINNCSIINDSYSADLNSLSVALDFLEQQQQHTRRTVILSDFLESGQKADVLYEKIASILSKRNLFRFIGIGPRIMANAAKFSSLSNAGFFESTESFLEAAPAMEFAGETILLKGARVFRFEKISHALQQKLHETVLEISLNALRHNLNIYRRSLKPETAIMAMVKAFSYGSGSFEVANLLQHAGVNYLAVAYADEGVELRKAGISLPIMVMNPEEAGFEQLLAYKLEPEIYSFNILNAFRYFLIHHNIMNYPIHIELDTGMHRLGFIPAEIDTLCEILKDIPEINVTSVFSHLAASDNSDHDDFTKQQAKSFELMSSKIEKSLGYSFMRHLSNSGAVHRHSNLQYNMVRLGIGLYGIDSDSAVQQQLLNVSKLKTTISQIKKVAAGESIGYSRKAIAEKEMTIAVVRIGYADGYPRVLSNGSGKMLINGMLAPVIGNICMDMTMLDISGMDAAEGDEVTVFGEFLPVNVVAEWAQTIPYEILTGVSQRVRRVYFEE